MRGCSTPKKIYCKIYYCNNLRFATFNKQAIKYSRLQKTDQLKKTVSTDRIVNITYQLSVLNDEAGKPCILNKLPSAQFLKA